MKMSLPIKKAPARLLPQLLAEPKMTPEDWRAYVEGWHLFNERKFWHSHEAWERVWIRTNEDSRIFFQGIIQLAAAYHLLLDKKRYGGAMRNFDKAEAKLRLFTGHFLGVEIETLLNAIDAARAEAGRIRTEAPDAFNPTLIPFITPRLPS